MSNVRSFTVDVTTATDQTATELTVPIVPGGFIESVHYTKTDFAAGVDFTITISGTGQNVWTEENVNASTVRAPRQPTHGQDGTASLYAAAGEPVEAKIAVPRGDTISVVIASGGSEKSGSFKFLIS
jgi:hypothetical protein